MRDHGLRDNVALLVLLEQIAGPQQQGWHWGTGRAKQNGSAGAPDQPPALLVGNTHLLFNPRRGDIKVCVLRSPHCDTGIGTQLHGKMAEALNITNMLIKIVAE